MRNRTMAGLVGTLLATGAIVAGGAVIGRGRGER